MTLSIAEFYAPSHWGDAFGPRIRNGVRGHHSGRDINGWKVRTGIPVLAGGHVTAVGRTADVGGFFEVQVAESRFDTYCHVVEDVSRGDVVSTGAIESLIAGYDDDHGTSWSGPHLHFMTATSAGAWANRALAINPDPVILAAIAGGGGGAGGVTPEKQKDVPMRIIFNKDAPAAEDATRRAIVGELSFEVITAAQSIREEKLWGAPVNFTVGEWNAARDLVNARRRDVGLPVAVTVDGPDVVLELALTGTATPKEKQ